MGVSLDTMITLAGSPVKVFLQGRLRAGDLLLFA